MYKSFNYIEPRFAIKQLEQLIKKRYIQKTSHIKPVVGAGKKYCAWCGKVEIKGRCVKYCSSDCKDSSDIFANPQSKFSLMFFLERQEFKCTLCGHDYLPTVEAIFKRYKERYKHKTYKDLRFAIGYWLSDKCVDDTKPEIDHIKAICNGGISLGIDNHRVICKKCHAQKTKEDKLILKG